MKIGKLIIRADASPLIGYGHIMRCLALANYFTSQNIACELYTSFPDKHISKLCEKNNILIHDIYGVDYFSEINFICKNNNPENKNFILLIDGYNFEKKYFKLARDKGFKVALLDDLADREIEADWLINHNVGAENNFEYKLINNGIELLGCEYAILRDDILNIKPSYEGGILITFGGEDSNNLGYKALEQLNKMNYTGSVHLVHTGDEQHYHLSKLISDNLPNYSLSRKGDILPYIKNANVALCAGGVTSLELAYLGIPMAITIIAENQKPGALSLEKSGAAITSCHIEQSVNNILSIVNNQKKINEMRMASKKLIDGNGVKRIYQSFMNS